MLGMSCQQVKQISPSPQLRYYKQLIVHTKHIVQPDNIIMPPQLPQHVDLLLQFGNVLGIIPQHDTFTRKLLSLAGLTAGMPLGFPPRCNADLSIGSFPNDQVPMEKVRWPPLRRIQLRRCRSRRLSSRTGRSDIIAHPSHRRVIIIGILRRGPIVSARRAVTRAASAPSGLVVPARGGAGAGVVPGLLLVVIVVVGGVGLGLRGLPVAVMIHDLHVVWRLTVVASGHGLHC